MISGSGDVVFDSGGVYLNSANTYTGLTTISASVILQSQGRLGTTDSGTVITSGQFVLFTNVVSNETLNINAGSLTFELRGNANQAGDIVLATTSNLEFRRATSGPAGAATISGTHRLEL